MSGVISIDINEVIKAFPDLINRWCEEQHFSQDKQRVEMCQIAVETFKGIYSEDHIRKCIKKEYKLTWRVNNGKKSWIGRAKEKVVDYQDNFSATLIEGTRSGRP